MRNSISLDEIDAYTAESQYNSWQTKQYETLDEFMLRKRKIELIALVRKVVENELSEKDKTIITLHWYEGKTITQTAEVLGVDKSTVSKRLERINEIVYDKLKYALEYRYGNEHTDTVGFIVKNKDALCCGVRPKNTAQRIKTLRLSQAMTISDVSEMTHISEERLEKIEKAEKDISAGDLAKIAVAFKTSADYIIFGSKERECCKWA